VDVSSTTPGAPAAAPALAGPRRAAVSAAFALGVLALAVAARRRGLDLPLFLAVNGWRGVPDAVWHLLGIAGLGVTALAVLTLGPRTRPEVVAALPWILLVGGGVTQAIKRLVPLPRPAALLDPATLHLVGDRLRLGSLPSGHAMTAAAVCAVLWMAGGPSWRRLPGAVTAGAATAAIALSRVATGAHWPSDVVAGLALGWAVASVSLPLARITRTEAFLASRAGQWALGAAQIGCGAAIAADASFPPALPVQWAIGALAFGAGMTTLVRRCAPRVAARAGVEAGT
jgi:undecaprenyl-diphosphatase